MLILEKCIVNIQYEFQPIFNSLWPTDKAHRIEVFTWNQCWLNVYWTLRNKFQSKHNDFIEENAFQNVAYKMPGILFRYQWVKIVKERLIMYFYLINYCPHSIRKHDINVCLLAGCWVSRDFVNDISSIGSEADSQAWTLGDWINKTDNRTKCCQWNCHHTHVRNSFPERNKSSQRLPNTPICQHQWMPC